VNYLKRLLKYTLPQWPKLIIIVFSLLVIAITFSASFLTLIPLLKVMMGQEGLHGWADRKLTEQRYDVRFYMPDITDLSSKEENYSLFLQLTKVNKKGVFGKAGLKPGDKIFNVTYKGKATDSATALDMLKELSHIPEDVLFTLKYSVTDPQTGEDSFHTTEIKANAPPSYASMIYSIARFIPEDNSANSKREAMKVVMAIVALLTVVRCVARFVQSYLCEKVVNVSLNNIRADVFRHLVNMPLGHFSREGSSDTVSRFLNDTNQAGSGIKIVFDKALREPLKGLVSLVMACMLNWQVVVFFALGAPFFGYTMGKLGKSIKKATRRSLMSWGQMLGKLTEAVTGLRAVKVYNMQGKVAVDFATVNNKLLKEQNKIARANALASPLLELIGLVSGIVGFMFMLNWVLKGNMETTTFFALLTLLGTSAESFRKASNVWNGLQQANAASERIFTLLDSELEPDGSKSKALPGFNDSIEFRNVVFRYPGNREDTLRGTNLTVKKGQNVAIVGSNGSGKTTLMNLLPRFYDPDSGEILIDGINIKDVSLTSLRSIIAIVSQRVITFNDSVANNIGFSKNNATMDEVIAAAKMAFAHEFIEKLPNGYDTMIGEEGAGLSGGQLQRIVIARAILKDPQILIFDEATSQVDSESESKIHKALEELTSTRTSFVIAHRFSTIVNSDVIAVMHNGEIVATGKHAELINSCIIYKNLYETQLLQ
jgi:subfamily B ATP-binding cassette protein MsbA